MTRLKYMGQKPYRVVYKDKVTILRKGQVIDIPIDQVKFKKMRSFENLDEKERRDKDLSDKIKKFKEEKT